MELCFVGEVILIFTWTGVLHPYCDIWTRREVNSFDFVFGLDHVVHRIMDPTAQSHFPLPFKVSSILTSTTRS